MADQSKIDYVQATINPLGWGCYGPHGSAENPNRCPWCYAYRLAKRNLRNCPDCRAFRPHMHLPEWEKPIHWRQPRRIFVQSMGDLFGNGVYDWALADLHVTAERAPQHTYLVLTKSPENAARQIGNQSLPPNVWLGTSVTCQADADERIPHLLRVPAAVRWLSIEPLLGEVDLSKWLPIEWSEAAAEWIAAWPGVQAYERQLQWVVIGRQTGPAAVKPPWVWVESLIDQCRAAGVPVWVKSNVGWPEQITEVPA